MKSIIVSAIVIAALPTGGDPPLERIPNTTVQRMARELDVREVKSVEFTFLLEKATGKYKKYYFTERNPRRIAEIRNAFTQSTRAISARLDPGGIAATEPQDCVVFNFRSKKDPVGFFFAAEDLAEGWGAEVTAIHAQYWRKIRR